MAKHFILSLQTLSLALVLIFPLWQSDYTLFLRPGLERNKEGLNS